MHFNSMEVSVALLVGMLAFSITPLSIILPSADAQQHGAQEKNQNRIRDPSMHSEILQERWLNKTDTTGMGLYMQHIRAGAPTIEQYPSNLSYMLSANGTATSFDDGSTEDVNVTIEFATWKSNNRIVSMDILNGTIEIGDREETVQAGHAYYIMPVQMLRIYGLVPDEGGNGTAYVKMLRITSIPASVENALPSEESDSPYAFESSVNSRLDAEYFLNLTGQVVLAGSVPVETTETITTSAGEEFTVELESNPTTGYSWNVTGIMDENIAGLVDSEYVPPETDLLGASGKQVFTFEALENGKTTITLEYSREFEDSPISRHVIEVTVSDESELVETTGAITTTAGEEFTVELESNPSTGYAWNVTGIADENVVRLVGTEYVPPESDLLGASGNEVFTFEALEEGNTKVTLEYARAFEESPIARHVVDVIVDDRGELQLTADKPEYARGEAVVFTAANHGSETLIFPGSALGMQIENLDTGSTYSVIGTAALTPIEPGQSRQVTWADTEEADPGNYVASIHTAANEDSPTATAEVRFRLNLRT